MPLRKVECVTCHDKTSRAVTVELATKGNRHTAAFWHRKWIWVWANSRTWQLSRLCSHVCFDIKKKRLLLSSSHVQNPLSKNCEVIEEKDSLKKTQGFVFLKIIVSALFVIFIHCRILSATTVNVSGSPAVVCAVAARSHSAGKAVFVNTAHRFTCHSFLCKRVELELLSPSSPETFSSTSRFSSCEGSPSTSADAGFHFGFFVFSALLQLCKTVAAPSSFEGETLVKVELLSVEASIKCNFQTTPRFCIFAARNPLCSGKYPNVCLALENKKSMMLRFWSLISDTKDGFQNCEDNISSWACGK